jgi:hypothetical protein
MKALCQKAVFLAALIVLVSGGCASKGVAHIESMAAAELAIREAQESTATTYAPLELKIAEDKLVRAREAEKQEDFLKSKRLADEAIVDAKFAKEKSLSEKAQKQHEEMRKSVETLRHEIERTQGK